MENSLLCHRHNIILTVSCLLIPSRYLKTAFFGNARSDEDHSWRLPSGGETELMTRSRSDDNVGARNGTSLTYFSNRDLTMTVIMILPLARSQKSDQRQLRSEWVKKNRWGTTFVRGTDPMAGSILLCRYNTPRVICITIPNTDVGERICSIQYSVRLLQLKLWGSPAEHIPFNLYRAVVKVERWMNRYLNGTLAGPTRIARN